MKFVELARVYEKLEATSSYNSMRDILAKFLKAAGKDELRVVCYLTLGRIAPHFADVNLGMAEKMVLRGIADAGNVQDSSVLADYKRIGDLGEAAERYASAKPQLSVKEVFDGLHSIAEIGGSGSQEKKVKLLSSLLQRSSSIEARYLVRIALGDLRLGAGDKTVLDALAIAYTGSKEARSVLEHAFMICPDIGKIAELLVKKGLKAVENVNIEVGIPIQMMLCQRVESLDELKKRTGFPVTVEQKYDGERIQAHRLGRKVVLYSRRLENITSQFPDIVSAVEKLPVKTAVIEGEVVAVDAKGNVLPFQVVMQRRRKYDVAEYVRRVPVSLRVFDVLFLNGRDLIRTEYEKRYALLRKIIKKGKSVELAESTLCNDVKCAEDFFQDIVQEGGEGIVIKSLSGEYQAGVRGWNWIKWKPEYVAGLRDTFDLVVIGAFYGRGRRAGKYGALLCAAYDDKADQFVSFCKLGTGFTDELLDELPEKLRKVDHKPARVEAKGILPDVWIQPELVVEVGGAEITKSPTHALGFALRFPRFLRFREKKPEQATSVREIKKML